MTTVQQICALTQLHCLVLYCYNTFSVISYSIILTASIMPTAKFFIS